MKLPTIPDALAGKDVLGRGRVPVLGGEPGETTSLTFGQAAVGGDVGTVFGTGSSPGAIRGGSMVSPMIGTRSSPSQAAKQGWTGSPVARDSLASIVEVQAG